MGRKRKFISIKGVVGGIIGVILFWGLMKILGPNYYNFWYSTLEFYKIGSSSVPIFHAILGGVVGYIFWWLIVRK